MDFGFWLPSHSATIKKKYKLKIECRAKPKLALKNLVWSPFLCFFFSLQDNLTSSSINGFLTEKTVSLNQRNFFFYIRSKKKFLWIKESFVNFKKISLIQRNKYVQIKENFFESTKLSLIQTNFFFDRVSKKCFFDFMKLFWVI